jgi:hypothetical protein
MVLYRHERAVGSSCSKLNSPAAAAFEGRRLRAHALLSIGIDRAPNGYVVAIWCSWQGITPALAAAGNSTRI